MSGRSYKGASVGRLKRALIVAAYDGRCWICGNRPPELSLDHIVPARCGGDVSVGNLRPACPRCNVQRDIRLKAMSWRDQGAAIVEELQDTRWLAYPLPGFNEHGVVVWLDTAFAESLPSHLLRLCPRATERFEMAAS